MANKIVLGNWKMHFTGPESEQFLADLAAHVTPGGVEVVLAPSNFALYALSKQKQWQFKLCAQNFYPKDFGAYTGETAIKQLVGVADYALVGHSERRHIFGETNADTTEKLAAALSVKITPVLCIGETALERQNGETEDVLRDQLLAGLSGATARELKNILIAYEPVWAISTTDNVAVCTPEDCAQAVKFIRTQVREIYQQEIRVLYGGSVNARNVVGYLTEGQTEGVLVGGASLQLEGFSAIIEAVKAVR